MLFFFFLFSSVLARAVLEPVRMILRLFSKKMLETFGLVMKSFRVVLSGSDGAEELVNLSSG